MDKASELINDSKAICMVPGGNEKDRIVKSSSGPRHTVTAKRMGRYSCDTEFLNFKSLGINFVPTLLQHICKSLFH